MAFFLHFDKNEIEILRYKSIKQQPYNSNNTKHHKFHEDLTQAFITSHQSFLLRLLAYSAHTFLLIGND